MSSWDEVIHIDQRGTYVASVAFGRRMAQRGRGSIINIASIAGMRSMPMHAYAPAKAAVIAITECLAAEWGAPACGSMRCRRAIRSRPPCRLRSTRASATSPCSTRSSALGRMVSPEEVARAVCFLASEDASAVTGANLPVDCGWLVTPSWHTYGGLRPARR